MLQCVCVSGVFLAGVLRKTICEQQQILFIFLLYFCFKILYSHLGLTLLSLAYWGRSTASSAV